MSNLLRIALAIVLLFAGSVMAQAEKRVALVIGNSSYKLISPLTNPKNDADLMAKTLKDVGFEVIVATDVDNRGMAKAVKKFGNALRGAGKNAVGLFYYAGHGVQSRGENYLIPLKAEVGTEYDLDIEAISASEVLGQMESAGNALNLVILDACRNNPFKTGFRSGTRGFARVNAPSGALVAFSAAPGQVAADGKGANSPYTAALVKAMRQPGLQVEQMFKRVRVAVKGQTSNSQTPWEESSLLGDFYFVPKASPLTSAVSPEVNTDSVATDYALAAAVGTKAAWKAFLARHGTKKDNFRVQLAEAALKKLAVGILPETDKSKIKRSYKPGDTFKDCGDCPEMVVVPAGSFIMGSSTSEKGRFEAEGPRRNIRIPKPFAVGKFEITLDQYRTFAKQTGHKTGRKCITFENNEMKKRIGRSYTQPGFSQTGTHPVVCVNWDDAKAYVNWLGNKTGEAYRLLSEAEWEYAARAGTTSRFNFGNGEGELCEFANGADKSSSSSRKNKKCSDGSGDKTTSVGSFNANGFGLYDMHGNVWEWVADCWAHNYQTIPSVSTPWKSLKCNIHVLRGGSWFDKPGKLRSANRDANYHRSAIFGFRVARKLTP